MRTGCRTVLVNLGRYGNLVRKSARARSGKWTTAWASVRTRGREPVEFCGSWGDYASYDPRAQAVTRPRRASSSGRPRFRILFDGEQNAGRRAAHREEGLFDALREKNHKAMEKVSFQRIVTTDAPHVPRGPARVRERRADAEGRGGPARSREVADRLFATGS